MPDFLQKVDLRSYRWKAGQQGLTWLFVADGPYVPPRSYNPMTDEPALFRAFIDLKPEEPGDLLAFANRYGPLGLTGTMYVEDWEDDSDESPRDTLEGWRDEIRYMRSVFEDWVAGTDAAEIQNQLNPGLSDVSVEFQIDQKRGGWKLETVPRNLISALWLQFVKAIVGNKQYKACVTCGKWIEVSSAANRPDRRYCSEACKARHYRDRKEQAAKLATTGKRAATIAKELETDEQTVRGWLKKGK